MFAGRFFITVSISVLVMGLLNFLFLPGPVLESCTFLRICPFLPRCPFYWHIIVDSTHADGAGGHQDHLMACILDVADDLAQLLHQPDVQVSGRVGQGAGADLDDDAHLDSSISHYFTAL